MAPGGNESDTPALDDGKSSGWTPLSGTVQHLMSPCLPLSLPFSFQPAEAFLVLGQEALLINHHILPNVVPPSEAFPIFKRT